MTDCINPECAAVRAELAELRRPRHPRDFGLLAAFTPTEDAIAAALLPPGRVVAVDTILGLVWPEDIAAGIVAERRHSFRVHLSRMRTVLLRAATGWRIPQGKGNGEYVLLAPGMALPAGFREAGNWRAQSIVPRQPCPECGGTKSTEARRCIACDRAARAALAAARRPIPSTCPGCGGPKKHTARRCWACHAERGAGLPPHGACADCRTAIRREATRCRPCEQARRRREPQRRTFTHRMTA